MLYVRQNLMFTLKTYYLVMLTLTLIWVKAEKIITAHFFSTGNFSLA